MALVVIVGTLVAMVMARTTEVSDDVGDVLDVGFAVSQNLAVVVRFQLHEFLEVGHDQVCEFEHEVASLCWRHGSPWSSIFECGSSGLHCFVDVIVVGFKNFSNHLELC